MENKKMIITGDTLIELGFESGKWFKEAIQYANDNSLEGESLLNYINTVCPLPFIEPFLEPVKYKKNIIAETEEESKNIDQVYKTMDVLMKTPTVITGCVMLAQQEQ